MLDRSITVNCWQRLILCDQLSDETTAAYYTSIIFTAFVEAVPLLLFTEGYGFISQKCNKPLLTALRNGWKPVSHLPKCQKSCTKIKHELLNVKIYMKGYRSEEDFIRGWLSKRQKSLYGRSILRAKQDSYWSSSIGGKNHRNPVSLCTWNLSSREPMGGNSDRAHVFWLFIHSLIAYSLRF